MLKKTRKMPAAKLWSVGTAGIKAIKKLRVQYNTRGKELSMRDKDARLAEIVFLGIVGAGIFIYGLLGLFKAIKKG